VTVIPVLLDSRPAYMDRAAAPTSLLLLPMGRQTVLDHLLSSLSDVTSARPLVLCTFEPDSDYERAMRALSPRIGAVRTLASFHERLATEDPSDTLLIIDSSCWPAAGFDVRPLLPFLGGDFEMVRHLIALDATPGRTKEYVQSAPDGRVRRIQRYYHPVTWPFASGLVCSLIPVSCFRLTAGLPIESLPALRRALAAQGVPSQDVTLPGNVFDLSDEGGVLALSEQFVFELMPSGGREQEPIQGERCTTHPSARLLGRVVLADDVVIEENALIAGPAVIGAGARIGRGATVAQCLVMPHVAIPAGATVRHRVVADADLDAVSVRRADGARPHSHASRHVTPVALPQYEAPRSVYPIAKRVVESVIACVTLVVLALPLAVIALLVKLTSRGPVFYGAQREGKGGVPFRCWKFRTMAVGADTMQQELMARNQMDGPQFKLARDPRVTTLGRWLRATNVDELPQLLNVVRGQMSFVGPRPSPFRENQICVPWRQGRLSVHPGITGLWQVCRHDRSNGDFHQWIQYDLLYIRHMGALVDLKILAATIFTLGGRRPVQVSWVIPDAQVEQTLRRRTTRQSRTARPGRHGLRWLSRTRS
jgi:lipopolysaccharide/colanic/teichoic acid biosynthesis glycosyltransferase